MRVILSSLNAPIALSELATTMHDLSTSDGQRSADDLEVIFKEMVQMCLW